MLSEESGRLDARYLMQCLPKREDILVTKAKGTKITDSSGTEYLDLFSGIAVANVGHCHPKVVEAIKSQIERYMHVSNYYYNDVAPALAEKLAGIAPEGLSRTFFCNSGTEAVDGAMKLAKKHAFTKGKSGMTIVSLKGSFHGRLSLTLTLTGQAKLKQGVNNYACYPGVVYASSPYHYRYGGDLGYDEFGKACADEMTDTIDNYSGGDVAAVLLEPILGEGGIIVPPDTYLPEVQEICKKRQIPLVIDEVQTGIGRTGKMFASEHWNVRPDSMALAKALGGGLPIGAFMSTEEMASSMKQGDHFSTFGGNPASCAAAIAVLEVMKEEDLVNKAARLGEYALKILREMEAKSRLIGDVRGKGLMIGIELVKDKRTKVPASVEAAKVRDSMRKVHCLIGIGGLYKNVLRIQPPLVVSREELNFALVSLQGSLKGL